MAVSELDEEVRVTGRRVHALQEVLQRLAGETGGGVMSRRCLRHTSLLTHLLQELHGRVDVTVHAQLANVVQE